MSGWVKIHRDLLEHWIWQEKPFSKGQAFVDIILLANHADKKVLLGNDLEDVPRGSFVTSELKLMDRWGWSKNKVRAFLKLLEIDNTIRKESNSKRTTINVVNYNKYQVLETTNEPQKNREETTKEPREVHKQEGKNDKNVKKEKDTMSSGTSAEPITEYPYKEIVEYLNQRTGKVFKDKSKDTQKHIRARVDEGYAIEDFAKVIDNKCAEWLGTNMEQYLRPSTLFGAKFEGYLNQRTKPAELRDSKTHGANNFSGRSYEMDKLELELLGIQPIDGIEGEKRYKAGKEKS